MEGPDFVPGAGACCSGFGEKLDACLLVGEKVEVESELGYNVRWGPDSNCVLGTRSYVAESEGSTGGIDWT